MGPKTAERAEFVVAALKEAKGELVSGNELMATLGMNKSNFYTLMMSVKKLYPYRIKSTNSHKRRNEPSGYYWVFKEGELRQALNEPTFKEENVASEAKEEVMYKYDEKKTEEGYNDPTAYYAMKRFEMEEANDTVAKKGDIWMVGASNGTSSKFVVLAAKGSSITCVPVYYENEYHEKEVSQLEKIVVAGKEVIVNPIRISTKPFKYFEEKVGEFSEDSFGILKGYIGLYLDIMGIQTIEVPVKVEKEVRVEVPVEVEKIPEGYISEEECKRRIEFAVSHTHLDIPEDYISMEEAAEMANQKVAEALIHQQAEIYKDFCEKLLKRAV